MLHLAGKAGNYDQCRDSAAQNLENGLALDKFRQMVAAQGGDVSFIEDPSLLPKGPIQRAVEAPTAGFVQELHAARIGLAAMSLGAGRAKKGDPIDHSVGIVVERKVGDRIRTPVASWMALAMAGATPSMGISATALAPYGPLGS